MKNVGIAGICRTLVLLGLLYCGSSHAASTFNPIPQDTFGSHFGYWEFLPNSYYTNPNKQLPIVIFFHGAGEVGNGRQPDLDVILKLGPPMILNTPSHPLHNIFDQNEAIVLAPQCPAGPGFQFWFSIYVSNFIRYARDHYGNRIDLNRVYLTGLSMGSGGIHELINNEPEEGLKAAAMLVTAAVGSASDTGANVGAVVPFWCLTAFGDSPWGTIAGIDRMAGKIAGTGPTNVMSTYPGSDVIRTATFTKNGGWVWQTGTNGASGVNPKLTLYPGGDHWSWGPTYDNGDVWNWLFAQRKGGGGDTTAPTITITSPTSASTWTTTGSTINLSGVANDNVGVSQVFWNNDRGGSGTASGTGNWSVNSIALQTGVNTITVTAQDAANNRSTATLRVTRNTPPIDPSGLNGLNAEYYNSTNLTALAFTRTDANVAFDWGTGGPGGSLGSDSFSVRWSGRIQPRYSETYTFSTISDDGVRLWINGQALINNWTDHAPTENSGTITLQAGVKYDIRMEYYESTGGAVAQLLWASNSQAKEIVPTSQLFVNGFNAEYYNTVDLTGPAIQRVDSAIDFSWGLASPLAGISADRFSVRWTGRIQPRFSENYIFYTHSDDGVRVWVNGQLIIDNWTDHGTTENAGSIALQAGRKYDLRMEYYENSGDAVARLWWSSQSQLKEIVPASQNFSDGPVGIGLNAEYFNRPDLTGPVLIRTDAAINFDWAYGTPDASLNADYFSVRWVGKVQPKFSETYTFYTLSDDGVRLWVNGVLLVDNWTVHPSMENSASITLQAGQKYDIRMEYFENWGHAVAKLSWSSPSQAKEIVPEAQLFPTGTGLNAQYFNSVALNTVVLERVDATVNFDFGNGSPAANISADNYSARWSGKVLPLFTENYTFSTITDDGVRLWVNGQLLINDWTLHGPTERSGSIALVAGQKYDIKMEWFENTGGASAKLSWQSSSQAKEVIPQSQLFAISTNLSSASAAFLATSSLAAQLSGDPETATAYPSIAEVGQTISFFAPVISADGLVYTWDFGDGAVGEGSSASHSYAVEGTYTATVTILDSVVGLTTSTVTVTITAAGGGAGGNGGDAGPTQPIKVKKFQLSLKFNSAGGDSIAISGSVPVAKEFNTNGAVIVTNVGGVSHSFTLNAKGAAAKGASTFKVSRKKKSPTEAQFQLRVKAGSFEQDFADEGLLDVDGKNQVRHIGLTILINSEKYAADVKTLYSSAKGKAGRAR